MRSRCARKDVSPVGLTRVGRIRLGTRDSRRKGNLRRRLKSVAADRGKVGLPSSGVKALTIPTGREEAYELAVDKCI